MHVLRVNNSRILTIKNAKFSGYYFYINLNIWGDFQFCISVPLGEKNNFIIEKWLSKKKFIINLNKALYIGQSMLDLSKV